MNNSFSERLKELRTAKGLTGEELGKAIGVSGATVSFWENRKSDIKSENLKKLAEFFGESIEFLLGIKDY